MNSFDKTLLPNTAGAEGYFNQSEAANTMKSFLEEKGFTEEDMMDEDALKELEKATRVDFLSRENWGNMIGTTAGIIAPLIATEMVPGSSVKVGNAVEKLVAGTNNVQKAAQYVNRATDAFDAAMSTTRLGRFLLPAVKEGVKFEATGRVFGSTEDEMYFMSGLMGGAASNAFTKVLAKMTPPQAAQYIQSMFGANANLAMKAIKKGGEAMVRGTVETVEESAQELTNIYTDELRSRGFFDEVQSRFGTLDEVQQFLVSSFIMGAGFGLVSGSTADEAYESLSDAKKKQVDDVLNAVKADYNYAEEKTEDYVKAQERQNKRQENVEKNPEIKQEVDEEGDIQFDVAGIERTAEGKPSSVEVKESTFTEPVDLFNIEGNDQENKPGVSGEERVGEKPVEEQPVAETSQEETSPSGVVQEEQVQGEKLDTEKDKDKRPRTTKIAVAKEQEVVEEAKVEEPDPRVQEIENRKKEELNQFKLSKEKTDEYNVPILLDPAAKARGDKQMYISRSTFDKAYANDNREGAGFQTAETLIRRGGYTKGELQELLKPEIDKVKSKYDQEISSLGKLQEPAATVGNPFEEIGAAKSLKGTAKTNAIKEIKQKYGKDYNRISKIDTNFASIVKDLEKNNLINKDCG